VCGVGEGQGVGRGLNMLLCRVWNFNAICVFVLVQCMAKGNFMTVKANKLKEQNLRVNISSKRKTFFFLINS